MTVVAAWIRETTRGAQEVVITSDSRLSGWGTLDCSPKIISLPRSDAAIAYAGDTFFAYPIIHQISEMIRSKRSLLDRVKDYVSLRNSIIKIMNEMYGLFHDAPRGVEPPDSTFILAGYSWFKKEFMIDLIKFDKGANSFTSRSAGDLFGMGKVCFAGDMGVVGVRNLRERLERKFGFNPKDDRHPNNLKFDMEPFEVVRDMLRSGSERGSSIGGAPQLISISQHMNSRQTAVFWPSKEAGKVYLGGCPVLELNYLDNWVLDPDTLKKYHMNFSK